MTNVPTVVAHADWSILPAKRWVATAHLRGDGYVSRCAPLRRRRPAIDRVLDALTLEATILAGFDFPIGVPTAYARVAGVRRFRALLDGARRTAFPMMLCVPDELRVQRHPQCAVGSR